MVKNYLVGGCFHLFTNLITKGKKSHGKAFLAYARNKYLCHRNQIQCTMRTLKLSIKQRYLDAIKDGRKVQEFREVRPNNVKKFLQLDADGFEIEDENANALPVEYDAILFTGKETGDTALVEVQGAKCEIMVDDKGQPIEYEYGGQIWVVERVVYDLGKIIEHNVSSRS